MDSILQEKIVAIKNAIDLLKQRSRYANGKARLGEISYYLQDPKIWENPDRFTQLTQEQSILKKSINQIHLFEKDLEDSIELFALAELESDLIVQKDMSQHLASLLQEISDATFESLLSDPIDHHNCFLELHAGAGGTESQDWTLMLMRMYLRWSYNHGYIVKILDESSGEEAGIKSAYIRIEGYNAYGWLKLEAGVHRLVRISPFDSNARRHTSFASVNAYPDVPDVIEIDLQDKDLKIDTYRASGAGGQHVNKTDSAVRITHLPTGVVVQCQNDRSQHKNKIEALRMLKSKLYNLERQKREETRDAMYEQQTDIAWGYQIRSYVMHPYQMVKDLRTNEQSNQVQKVLDGDIDPFLKAMLVYEHRD